MMDAFQRTVVIPEIEIIEQRTFRRQVFWYTSPLASGAKHIHDPVDDFAVVAGEVKSLANQTAKATEEISGQVGAMQEATAKAVTAIRGISATIEEVNQISSSITSSVDEQRLATQEISENIQQAANSTNHVSTNIGGVGKVAVDTKQASEHVLKASHQLSTQAGELRTEVDKFLVMARAK